MRGDVSLKHRASGLDGKAGDGLEVIGRTVSMLIQVAHSARYEARWQLRIAIEVLPLGTTLVRRGNSSAMNVS